MLIEPKNIKSGDVVTLKLVGGDEVIGRLADDLIDGQAISLKKPMLVAMAQQGFGLMPFALTIDPEVTVTMAPTHVITVAKTIDAVAKEYIKQTTGLIT